MNKPRLLAALFVLTMAACGSESPGQPQYQQTWTKNYSETTCADWGQKMSADQRTAAAADMLTGARNKGDGGAGLPPVGLVRSFEVDVTTACSADSTDSIATIGASVYLIGRMTYRP